jgi:hypothetical protein
LTGYAAPFDQNPYVEDSAPRPRRGELRPAGTYYVVFDSPSAAGAGSFRFLLDRRRRPAERRARQAHHPLRQ